MANKYYTYFNEVHPPRLPNHSWPGSAPLGRATLGEDGLPLVSGTSHSTHTGNIMDHLRGNLFDTAGQTRFEGLEITIETRTASGGGEEWSGYFEPPTASGLISGEVFRLVLEDGRAGTSRSRAWRQWGTAAPGSSSEPPIRSGGRPLDPAGPPWQHGDALELLRHQGANSIPRGQLGGPDPRLATDREPGLAQLVGDGAERGRGLPPGQGPVRPPPPQELAPGPTLTQTRPCGPRPPAPGPPDASARLGPAPAAPPPGRCAPGPRPCRDGRRGPHPGG